VDLERGVLYFDQSNTKSGKQREIPISPELGAMLRDRRKVRDIRGADSDGYIFTRKGRPIRRFAGAFTTARKRAGLGADVTPHTCRHTFASWYMINGWDLYCLRKYLGHSTIILTQRYAHLSKDYLKAGVEFIGAPRGGSRSHPVVTGEQEGEAAGFVSA
jgi:integrase